MLQVYYIEQQFKYLTDRLNRAMTAKLVYFAMRYIINNNNINLNT